MAVIPSRQLLTGGLTHGDWLVREACIDYFCMQPRQGIDVTRAVLKSLDLYGPDAFLSAHQLKRLPMDGEAMDRVERHLETLDWRHDWTRVYHYLDWMTDGPPERLPRLLQRLQGDYAARAPEHPRRLTIASLRASATRRLNAAGLGALDCFDALVACFFEADELEDFTDDLFADAETFVDRLLELKRPDQLRPLVEEWLDFDLADETLPAGLSTAMGVYLAGRCGFTDQWERLLRLFEIDDDWMNDYLMEAFTHMADWSLLARLRGVFEDLDWHARLYLACVFECHQLPGFEEFYELMTEPWEGGDPIRNSFAMALALYGAPHPLAAAQRCYDADPDEPESQAFGQMLYAQYLLRGIDHPAIPLLRRNLLHEQARTEAIIKRVEPPPRANPLTGMTAAPGRNDPCPCGSGRKYKKCCMRKA
jgi:hypothetical protein